MRRYVRLLEKNQIIDTTRSNRVYCDYGSDIARYWLRCRGLERELITAEFIQSDDIFDLIKVGDIMEIDDRKFVPLNDESARSVMLSPKWRQPFTAVWIHKGNQMKRISIRQEE